MQKFIPLSSPNLHGNEEKYVVEAIRAQWVSTGGVFITDFEREIARYLGVEDAAACQNGTSGLHLALMCAGIGPGDEVIVPTLTFIAAVNPIKYVGADCVFMDCDDTLCIDIDKLEDFLRTQCVRREDGLWDIQSGKQVKAVLPVHVFGNITDMPRLLPLARQYGLKVIEDATEALGSRFTQGDYADRFAGTIGDIGVFSFNGNKIITTGGGGMVVSNDKALTTRARHLSTQAKADELFFVHDEIGYNYRMTNLQAAVGLAQLEQLEDFIAVKQRNYDAYGANGIELLPFRKDIRSNKWFYSYMTENRNALIAHLGENKIQARPVWRLIHTLKPYENSRTYHIERAHFYYDRIINLPCSTNLSQEDVVLVAEIIRRFVHEHHR